MADGKRVGKPVGKSADKANEKAGEKPVLSDPITLRVPQDILDDIEKIAQTADRTRSWVIVRALKYYLINEGSDLLEIRQGLDDVKAGRMHDADEVFAELERLSREDAA